MMLSWTQIGIFVAAILVEFGRAGTSESVRTWSDMLSVPIVSGAILNLGLQLGGLFTRPPQK